MNIKNKETMQLNLCCQELLNANNNFELLATNPPVLLLHNSPNNDVIKYCPFCGTDISIGISITKNQTS